MNEDAVKSVAHNQGYAQAASAILECGHPAQCLGTALDGIGCGWCADIVDMGVLINHLSRTYDYFTDGRVSKPMTLPEVVFRIADDLERERFEEWQEEQQEEGKGIK